MQKEKLSNFYPLPYHDERGLESSQNPIIKALPDVEKAYTGDDDRRDQMLNNINLALSKLSEYGEEPFKEHPNADFILRIAYGIKETPMLWRFDWNIFPYNGSFYTVDKKFSLNRISAYLPKKLRGSFETVFNNVYNYIEYTWKKRLLLYPDLYYNFGIKGYVNYLYNDRKRLYEKIYPYIVNVWVLETELIRINNCEKNENFYTAMKSKSFLKVDYAVTLDNKRIILAKNPVAPVITYGTGYVNYDINFFKKEFHLTNNKYIAPLDELIKMTNGFLKHSLSKTDLTQRAEELIFNYRCIANAYFIAIKVINDRITLCNVTEDNTAICLKPSLLQATQLSQIKDCYPAGFIRCLNYFNSVSEKMVDELAILTANCLYPHPLYKKLFLFKTDDKKGQKLIKDFLRKLLSSSIAESYEKEIIEPCTVSEFCDQRRMKRLYELRYANVKAAFLDKTEEVSRSNYNKLKNLMKNKNKISERISRYTNSIQPVIFQTSELIGDLRSKDTVIFDFSYKKLDDIFSNIPDIDFEWAKVYFALYGYDLITHELTTDKNKTNDYAVSDAQFDSEKDDLIKKIIDKFLDECFVSVDDAKSRAKKRPEIIKKIKKNRGKNIDEQELTEILSETPLYATYKDEFLRYIGRFIEIRYNPLLLSKYDITAKMLLEHFMNDPKYQIMYPYKDIHLNYTTHKRNDAFTYLSLKKPWAELEAELDKTVLGLSDDRPKPSEANETDFYKKIMRDIDFSDVEKLSFKDTFFKK